MKLDSSSLCSAANIQIGIRQIVKPATDTINVFFIMSSTVVVLIRFFVIFGLDWRLIEAHKSRQHHGGNAATHWSNSSDANQRPPLFDWESSTTSALSSSDHRIQEVTTTLGQTAFLHCRVRYLGDRRVLWMRQRDLHILTSSLHTYTNDWRISAVHTTVRSGLANVTKNSFPSVPVSRTSAQRNATADVWDDEEGVWSEWTLRIRATEAKDGGLYECQVSTEPKISKIYRLHVVVSKASILGSVELFVKKGSDINLTCVTVTDEEPLPPGHQQQPANKTPLHFTWHHNGQVLNYSARGGMSVTTDTIGGQSRLLLARADPRDSGNYTCVPGPGATPASVTVHVLNGEQPAAMQRDNAAGLAVPWWTWGSSRTSLAAVWTTLIITASTSWVIRSQLSNVT